MPYKNPEDKAQYMAEFHKVNVRVFTAVSYYNFSNDAAFIRRMVAMQNKHNVQFYCLWHDDHMQMVIYSNSRRNKADIMSILREVDADFAKENSVLESSRTLSVELRYLLHLDDPDKKQYHPNDFIIIGNADPLKKIQWISEELEEYLYEVIEAIRTNRIGCVNDLLEMMKNNRIYKYIYRKQAYKDDINRAVCDVRDLYIMRHNDEIAEKHHKEQLEQQQRQHEEMMTALTGIKQSEQPETAATADKNEVDYKEVENIFEELYTDYENRDDKWQSEIDWFENSGEIYGFTAAEYDEYRRDWAAKLGYSAYEQFADDWCDYCSYRAYNARNIAW